MLRWPLAGDAVPENVFFEMISQYQADPQTKTLNHKLHTSRIGNLRLVLNIQ